MNNIESYDNEVEKKSENSDSEFSREIKNLQPDVLKTAAERKKFINQILARYPTEKINDSKSMEREQVIKDYKDISILLKRQAWLKVDTETQALQDLQKKMKQYLYIQEATLQKVTNGQVERYNQRKGYIDNAKKKLSVANTLPLEMKKTLMEMLDAPSKENIQNLQEYILKQSASLQFSWSERINFYKSSFDKHVAWTIADIKVNVKPDGKFWRWTLRWFVTFVDEYAKYLSFIKSVEDDKFVTAQDKTSQETTRDDIIPGMEKISKLITDELKRYHSPIKTSEVWKTFQSYKVPVAYLMAFMKNDSAYGTAGAWARHMNPGNVYNIRGYAKFKSRQDGMDAMGKNLRNRINEYQKIYGNKRLPTAKELAENVWPDGKWFLSTQWNYKKANAAQRLGWYMILEGGSDKVQSILDDLTGSVMSEAAQIVDRA